MSVCAVMMIRDDLDVVAPVVAWIEHHADDLLVVDHCSTDGTSELLAQLGVQVLARRPNLDQGATMSELAEVARARGHEWVIPYDADEAWLPPGRGRLADWLAALPPEVLVATGHHLNHVPTTDDAPSDLNPFTRMRWREPQHGWRKVACRLRPGLLITQGNHDCHYPDVPAPGEAHGLEVHHFQWRSPEQAVKKIRAGIAGADANPLADPHDSTHKTRWRHLPDSAILDFYRGELRHPDPALEGLMLDPLPPVS